MFWLLLLGLFFPPEMDEKPLNYFLENRTEKCWVLDRTSNKQVVSIASTGFGMAAWAIAAQDGRISREQAITWITTCLDETVKANKGNRGWLYHFTDLEGKPIYDKQVSSIDSALFFLGARWAAAALEDKSLIEKVEKVISEVDQNFMMTREGARPSSIYYSHGFIWKDGKAHFLECDWGDELSEGVLIYRLFDKPYHPNLTPENLPLFTYYYPLCFYKDQAMIDHLGRAIDNQLKNHGIVGYTACDGPDGYGVMQADVISPLAVASCEPFYAKKLQPVWKTLRCPKTTPAIQLKTGWTSQDHIGIDEGAYILTHYRRQYR